MSLDDLQISGIPDVDAILATLLAEARAILGDAFFGMYLYGSLATGDFDPGSSDIDFVVVTKEEVPDETVHALEAMHMRLMATGGKWAQKLEGSYIPLAQLRRRDESHNRFPSINKGHFFIQGDGYDCVIQRQTLREHPVALAGPDLRDTIDPVTPDDIRQAVLRILDGWWKPLADDAARLQRDDYQAFAVLSMCRARYALAYGEVVSKPVAARWARASLAEPWDALIARAMEWYYGMNMDALDPVRAFIHFTLDKAGIDRLPPKHAG